MLLVWKSFVILKIGMRGSLEFLDYIILYDVIIIGWLWHVTERVKSGGIFALAAQCKSFKTEPQGVSVRATVNPPYHSPFLSSLVSSRGQSREGDVFVLKNGKKKKKSLCFSLGGHHNDLIYWRSFDQQRALHSLNTHSSSSGRRAQEGAGCRTSRSWNHIYSH